MSEDIKDFLTTLEEYANGFDNIIAPHEDTIKDFLSYFNELQQENKQLKSILTELEEWCKSRIDEVKYNSFDEVLDKIQELKEKYK